MERIKVVITITAILLLMIGGALLQSTGSEVSVRWSLRRTADFAFVLFVLSFGAASIHYFMRTNFSTWLMRNRRYIGIGFAIVFLTHGLLVGLMVLLYPEPFLSQVPSGIFYGGALSFSAAAIMGISSNDLSIRLLGRRVWSALHTTLGYYLCLSWALAYFNIVKSGGALFSVCLVLALGVFVLRWSKWVHLKVKA